MTTTKKQDSQPQDDISTKASHEQEELGVVVIGAGAAGLTAAYDLKRKNIPVRVLEANATIGGRIRKLEDFADYPIDLGAEWIHADPSMLDTIVDDPTVDIDIDMEEDDTSQHKGWTPEGKWQDSPFEPEEEFYRFTKTTWYDFFNDFIAPKILGDIVCGCVVDSIDYSKDNENGAVLVTCKDGRTFAAAQVIVTVGMKILQDGDIDFIPCLPFSKRRAIQNVPYEAGLKVFLEFSKQFYHNSFHIVKGDADQHGEIYYWNVSSVKESNKNVLGVFLYGEKAVEYTKLEGEEVIRRILADLDMVFDGQASTTYMKHFVQNWTESEPFIRGLYTSYRKAGLRPMYTIMQPVQKKIFFAGEALPPSGNSYGYVHGAALSGRSASDQIQRVRSGLRLAFNSKAFAIHVLSTVCFGFEHRLFFDESD